MVPTKTISKKPLVKVDLEVWMEASNCKNERNGPDPCVDPTILAGVKAADGLYFAKNRLLNCYPGAKGKATGKMQMMMKKAQVSPCVCIHGRPGRNRYGRILLSPDPSEIKSPPMHTLDDGNLSDISAVY